MNKSSKMTMLAFLAYDDFYQPDCTSLEQNVHKTLLSVKSELDFQEIAWGPAAHKNDHEIFTDSLMYAVKHSDAEYSLVIRGTNPVSLQSWLFQDLNVGGQVPWSRQSTHTKADRAYISKATDTAMSIHTNLKSDNQTALNWLSAVLENSAVKLNVIGHSLGGLMSTTFALWLYDEILYQGLGSKLEMEVFSFAAPTAGNEAFKSHSDACLTYHSYRNNFDIATHVWDQQDMTSHLLNIYGDIQLKPAEKAVYDYLVNQVRSLGYAKLENNTNIPGKVCENPLFSDYFVQAGYQHVVPYLKTAFMEAPIKVCEIVIQLIRNLFSGDSGLKDFRTNEQQDIASYITNELERLL